jgi:hypothetical protein
MTSLSYIVSPCSWLGTIQWWTGYYNATLMYLSDARDASALEGKHHAFVLAQYY